MTERPMLFQAEMVRAYRREVDPKTQTRRLSGLDRINEEPDAWEYLGFEHGYHRFRDTMRIQPDLAIRCPYGVAADRLWCVDIKPIEFGDGKYGVGDDGNVYDISGAFPKERKIRLSHNGYEEITLRNGGKCGEAFRVNRLVCEAFYGPCPPQFSVCRHMDGNRRNNTPGNLDWGTPAQNTADANATGAWSGAKNKGATLSDASVMEIRQSLLPQKELAVKWGVGQPTISKIRSGKRWRSEHPSAPPRNSDRWASRDTLEVISAVPQRLRDITEADAKAEGCEPWRFGPEQCMTSGERGAESPYRGGYACLWDDINEGVTWFKNPWVWKVTFRRLGAENRGMK